jgi:beta-lactamase superfamily II metal-dependent hydrolase
MIVDCGGSSGDVALAALESMHAAATLALTHLHRDHYVGLVEAAQTGKRILHVKKLILPRIPEFEHAYQFRVAFMAMMARLSRAETGIRVYDAARWLAAVNRRPFERRFVSANDSIELGDRRLRVLWPPKEIFYDEALVTVRRALNAFDEALKSDEVLREEHELASQLPDQETDVFGPDVELPRVDEAPAREVPSSTRQAENKLRAVANRLSLAFHDGGDLLMWGDQEETEIRAIADGLLRDGLSRFNVMVTPHHGTHWPSGLRHPRSVVAVTSAGERRIGNFKKGLIQAEVHRSTYLEGTIQTAVGWW